MSWLVLVPAAFFLFVYVLAFAICRAAGRADRFFLDRAEQEVRDARRGVYRPRGGGWRI